jgi:hypothetical protein
MRIAAIDLILRSPPEAGVSKDEVVHSAASARDGQDGAPPLFSYPMQEKAL